MKYSSKKQILSLIAAIGASLGFLLMSNSCGKTGGGSSSSNASATGGAPGPLIQIPFSLTESQSTLGLTDGLGLAGSAPGGVAPDTGTIVYALQGCASGLTASSTASQSAINVYINDTGCYVKLTAFTLHGTVYNLTNSGAVAFSPAISSGANGQVATFAGSSSTDLITVKSVSQLSSPIVNADYVSYEFTIIKSGTNSASITVSNSQSLYTAGQDAPNFNIAASDITYNGMTSGVGNFTFTLTCTNGPMTNQSGALTYHTFCPTVASGTVGVDIGNSSAFSYKLINDANGNGTLTMAQAQAAMASGDTTFTASAGNPASPYNSFVTATLAGPGLLHSYPKMILILQAKNTAAGFSGPSNSSFQYFAISFTPVTP